MRVALVVPHIFMQKEIMEDAIFSPGELAIDLAYGLAEAGEDVTLFTPGPVEIPTKSNQLKNFTADRSGFENELRVRGDSYMDLLKKHPLTFITLSRQLQGKLIANAFARANAGEFDLVHIYTNEEELGMIFARLCKVPVVFTHHDPFNFQVKYRAIMPEYKDLNWVSISMSQRKNMPQSTNWVGNVYHGIDPQRFKYVAEPKGDKKTGKPYIAYLGRIVEPKGVHLAIAAAKEAGVVLKIAGKHYAGFNKDTYWSKKIKPYIDNKQIQYTGFLKTDKEKQDFLGNAQALIVPSTWDEPFGMVIIEALACGTPVVGLQSGAIPEIIENKTTGLLVEQTERPAMTIKNLAKAITDVKKISRTSCRAHLENNFSSKSMCQGYLQIYTQLQSSHQSHQTKS